MQTLSQVTIASLGQRGEGVAEIDSQRVYVPFTLPGETVEITIEGERGHLLSILEPSPHRIDPFCPHFGVCGGCQLQHLDRPSYDAFKIGLIENALSHAGITTPVGALIDARGVGRRRATLHARKTGAGYMMAKSHDLLDIDRCPILVPALARTPEIARGAYAAIGGDCDVSFTASATGLDVAIRTEKKPRNDKLVTFAQRFALARLVVNGELVLQAQQPLIRVGKSMVDLPRASFLQATEAAEEALSTLVVQALAGTKSVADLFCGMGPFALRLAETMKVFAADNDKPAILALEKAVRNTRGLKPVTAMTRDLFRDSMVPVELAPFDGVVFDPPRAGAEAQAHELALSKVKKIVAVSCDPKTFARDAAILIGGGYKLQSVTPVDQFAFSTHVELVGVFAR